MVQGYGRHSPPGLQRALPLSLTFALRRDASTNRMKDGKDHRYVSVVEDRRLSSGTTGEHVKPGIA
jgi:hypothetical protein